MIVYWVWLSLVPHVPMPQKLNLLRCFGDAEGVYHADERSYYNVRGITEKMVQSLNGLTEKWKAEREREEPGGSRENPAAMRGKEHRRHCIQRQRLPQAAS